MSEYSRRESLKLLGALSTASACAQAEEPDEDAGGVPESPLSQDPTQHRSQWHRMHDRTWIGRDYWANPMEGWQVRDGAIECLQRGGNRNVHLITHHLRHTDQSFEMSVTISRIEPSETKPSGDGAVDDGVGFLIGVKSELDETKSNAFARKGLTVGLRDSQLWIGGRPGPQLPTLNPQGIRLQLTGEPRQDDMQLTLRAVDSDGVELGRLLHAVPQNAVRGNVALVNCFDAGTNRNAGARHRFHDWRVSGDAFDVRWEHAFGPILWSMYSLSDSRSDEGFVLKLSALLPPMGSDDHHHVQLQVRRGERWVSHGEASIDLDAWTATFRIANWDETDDVPFQLVYKQTYREGADSYHDWTGVIKANPVNRPVQLAALTCQKDYGFPYAPVAENIRRLDPDLIYFSGDQLYESHGGYGLIREPADAAIINYLRKFYMFGWAFREPMRFAPTLCIPDDHDVFQGNIWGEGGAAMKATDQGVSSKGGYREPVRMVNVVHRTCAGHHPDPFDPNPASRGMSVYYGDMVYGGVSFAILGDRQFKSGPEHVDTGSGRADHVRDPTLDTERLDSPELSLLGERQEDFLRQWSRDWRGARLKVLLSQTVFAGVATHHGSFDGYLKADLDSGGWPQSARNRAIDFIRESGALHVNGDQHLTSLTQYGVADQRDSNWSFCVPAIAAGYPRWWRPDEVGMPHRNRPEHGMPNTGEYRDGFNNRVYVYAVGNPDVGKSKNRYDQAHEKGSGFGYIIMDPTSQTYEIHSYRFAIDATDGDSANEFPGWPVIIHADENRGRNRLG
ncbi:MAG: alkaline phosphatase D family protein [Planctomycetota bacterium]